MEDGKIHRNYEISTPIDSARDLPESGIIQSKRLYETSGKTHLKRRTKKNMETIHPSMKEMKHKCPECSYQTNYKQAYNSHKITHSGIKPFECNVCEKKFTTKRGMKMHIKNQHSSTIEKEYKCCECSYQTNYKQHLSRHKITHSGIKSFECGVCEKKFAEKGNLKKHIQNQHLSTMEKKFKCSDCSYQTNSKPNLSAHKITHSRIKSFACGVCQKKFTKKDSLKVHIRNQHSSTMEKKYKCLECSYQTNYKSALSSHSVTHSGIKPLECGICKMKCTQKYHLKMHIKDKHSNTVEKEYKCSECSFQTNNKRNLSRHSITHSGIKPFECDVCKMKFSQKCSLKRHIKGQHSSTMETEYTVRP